MNRNVWCERGRRAITVSVYKRYFIGVLLLICSVLLLQGCGNKLAKLEEKRPEKEQLVLWSYYETDAQKEALHTLIQSFNRSQGKYEVIWKYVPLAEFTKQLSIGMTEEQLPDMVIIDNPDMKTYVNLGMFEDITMYVNEWTNKQNYYETVLKTVEYEGKYYGIPICCNNLALIYNVDRLKQAGLQPPTNWEEFVETAKRLSTESTYGFAMSAFEGEQCAFQVLPWILSEGENMDRLGGEATVAAYTKLDMLMQNGYMDRNCVNWSQIDVARKFVSGEAAMIENGPWVFPMIQKAGISYGIVPLPCGNKVILGGENIGIIKGKNMDGSISFLQYYNQDDVMLDFCKTANVLTPKRILSRQELEENQELQVFEEQIDTATARTSFADWEKISKSISNATYQIFTGSMTAEEAAESLK